mmetsp:Transcript_11154/g.36500  ORF Transcript_11154/g.36500 Transcript_11154/m.36500 type:complete len:146 (+) Transcript_11154:258-695(+)
MAPMGKGGAQRCQALSMPNSRFFCRKVDAPPRRPVVHPRRLTQPKRPASHGPTMVSMENPLHRFMLVWLSVRYFVSQISDEKDSEMDKYKKSAMIAAIIFVFWTIVRTLNASQARYEQEQHKEERAAVELAMKADAEQKEKKKDK